MVGLCSLAAGCSTDRIHASALAFSDAASMTLAAETRIANATNALATAELRSRARLWYLDNPRHPSRSLVKPPGWTPDYIPIGSGPVSEDALADRTACLTAVQAYAQSIATLTSGTNTANVDTTTTALFGTLSNIVKASGGTLSANAKGIAATAIDELGRVVINALTTREVIVAARRAQAPLAAIAQALSSEALLESSDQKNKLASLSMSQGLILYRVWNDPAVSAEGRFDVWERLMQERDVQAVRITEDEINRSLANIVKANDALATGDRVSFGELAMSAKTEADHAISYYESTTK